MICLTNIWDEAPCFPEGFDKIVSINTGEEIEATERLLDIPDTARLIVFSIKDVNFHKRLRKKEDQRAARERTTQRRLQTRRIRDLERREQERKDWEAELAKRERAEALRRQVWEAREKEWKETVKNEEIEFQRKLQTGEMLHVAGNYYCSGKKFELVNANEILKGDIMPDASGNLAECQYFFHDEDGASLSLKDGRFLTFPFTKKLIRLRRNTPEFAAGLGEQCFPPSLPSPDVHSLLMGNLQNALSWMWRDPSRVQ